MRRGPSSQKRDRQGGGENPVSFVIILLSSGPVLAVEKELLDEVDVGEEHATAAVPPELELVEGLAAKEK